MSYNKPSTKPNLPQKRKQTSYIAIILLLLLVCLAAAFAAGTFIWKSNSATPVVDIGVESTTVAFVTATPEGAPAQVITSTASSSADISDSSSSEAASSAPENSSASSENNPASAVSSSSAAAAPVGNIYSMSSPDYGMQAFLFWRPEVADRDLKLVTDAGFTWVKQEFAWREIEPSAKGGFNWENTDRMMDQITKHQVKVLARLGVQPQWAGGNYPDVSPPTNYQDFADFAFAVASRYKGRIGAYQVWNEPNLSREWGNKPPNPAEYTQLLKVTYEAIKRADPNAIVVTAGLAPTTRSDAVAMPDTYFVQGIYDAGAKPYFDMLGVHGAGYKAPPDMDPALVAKDQNYYNPGDLENGVPEELRRIYCFRHVEDVRAIMVKNNDADKRVVVLEFGWTVDKRPDSPYYWHHVGETEQGKYLVGAYEYAKQHWQPWIALMSLIYLPNPDWTDKDEQTYWSIVQPKFPELIARKAYWMLKDMPK